MKRNLHKNVFIILLMLLFTVAMIGCTPKVKPDPPYIITYSAGIGGCIRGEKVQTIEKDSDGTLVTADPHDGYLFAGWSDGVMGESRKEKNVNSTLVTAVAYPVKLTGEFANNMGKIERDYKIGSSMEVTAIFLRKIKTLSYEYNDATSNNTEKGVTLSYEHINDATFVIPKKENYIFDGWYLDPKFTIKVTDENGFYYNGRSIFYSESNTLHAKWLTEKN